MGGAGPWVINSRWVGSGYGRWVGGTFSDSRCGPRSPMQSDAVISHTGPPSLKSLASPVMQRNIVKYLFNAKYKNHINVRKSTINFK